MELWTRLQVLQASPSGEQQKFKHQHSIPAWDRKLFQQATHTTKLCQLIEEDREAWLEIMAYKYCEKNLVGGGIELFEQWGKGDGKSYGARCIERTNPLCLG